MLTIEKQALLADPATWNAYGYDVWHDFVSDELVAIWHTFTDQQKVAIAKNADSISGQVELYPEEPWSYE